MRALSHRIADAMALARRRRLGTVVTIARDDSNAIKALNVTYASTQLRYIVTGSTKVPRDVAEVAHAAERLVLGMENYCTGYTGHHS